MCVADSEAALRAALLQGKRLLSGRDVAFITHTQSHTAPVHFFHIHFQERTQLIFCRPTQKIEKIR